MFTWWRGLRKKIHPQKTHTELWAALTILSFPLVATCAILAGLNSFVGFFGGAFASVLVITLEALSTGRVWIADTRVTSWLGHPTFGFRLTAFVGVVMLIFETYIIVGFLANSGYDPGLLNFILNRNCSGKASQWSAPYCVAQMHNKIATQHIDPVLAAIRDDAAKRLFQSSSLVSCAAHPVASHGNEIAAMRIALIRCDSWYFDTASRELISMHSSETTAAILLKQLRDGSYEVIDWSNDPASTDWARISQGYGDVAAQVVRLIDLDGLRQSLANESHERALQTLSRF